MSLERFVKVYTSLPLEERKLTVVIIDGEPINWIRAHEEIKNNTQLGKKIQEKLMAEGII